MNFVIIGEEGRVITFSLYIFFFRLDKREVEMGKDAMGLLLKNEELCRIGEIFAAFVFA